MGIMRRMAIKLTRDEKKARTRERLLDAAIGVFAEHGYAGATLDAIAAEAGLTKGAVYSNFESKEDLFFALIDRGLGADLTVLADESRPLVERFVDFVSASVAVAESRRGRAYSALELEFALLAQRDERARALVREINQRTRERLGAFLDEQAAREGLALPMEGQAFATMLLGALRGILQQRAIDPEAVSEELVADAVRLLFRG